MCGKNQKTFCKQTFIITMNRSKCFYLNHYDWSTIGIEIWFNVHKQDTHPAINSGNILCVNKH